MKALTIFLFIIALTVSVKAQDSPLSNYNNLKNRKFNLDSAYKELPKLKFNESHRGNLLQPGQGDAYIRNPSLSFNNLKSNTPIPNQDNMPVYKPMYFSEMPTFKPDSSVKYHMLVKKVGEKILEDRLTE